jgi:hypothetical protein
MDEQEARFTRLYQAYYRNVFGYVVLRVAPCRPRRPRRSR